MKGLDKTKVRRHLNEINSIRRSYNPDRPGACSSLENFMSKKMKAAGIPVENAGAVKDVKKKEADGR